MTTAHRPTWKAAVGQDNEGGWSAGGAVSHQKSALDAPAHTKLKVRQQHQLKYNNKEQMIQQSLKAIQDATKDVHKTKYDILHHQRHAIDPKVEEQSRLRLLQQTNEVDVAKIKAKYDDSDVEGNDDDDDDEDKEEENSDLDAPDDDDDDDDSDEDDDDEDDEMLLQAELAKIRAEREAKKQQEESKINAEEMIAAEQAAILGNPLLNFQNNNNNNNDTASVVSGMTNTTSGTNMTTGRLKRRWNDDVIFRNQAQNEPKHTQKRFINDTVRNDFHKRFLNKFIR
jgi:protein CWC15